MDMDRTKLDVKYYLESRLSDPTIRERGVTAFYMKSFHDFYKNNGEVLDHSSTRVMEFGGGPCVISLISAAPSVSEITFADYSQSCLDAVIAWKNDCAGSFDWTYHFEHVISKLEGEQIRVKEMAVLRQLDLKSKLTQFIRCNIQTENIFDHKLDGVTFDIVSTNFCLDIVAASLQEYQLFVKRTCLYVKPGGFMISMVGLEQTYWYATSEDIKTPHVFLTEGDVKEAFTLAGLTVVYTAVHPITVPAQFSDCKYSMFIVGKL